MMAVSRLNLEVAQQVTTDGFCVEQDELDHYKDAASGNCSFSLIYLTFPLYQITIV